MAAEEEGLDCLMTAEHLKKPRIQDRIWLLTRAKLCLDEAQACLVIANPDDPQLSWAANRTFMHDTIIPLSRLIDDLDYEIRRLANYNPGDGVRRWTRAPEPVWEESPGLAITEEHG